MKIGRGLQELIVDGKDYSNVEDLPIILGKLNRNPSFVKKIGINSIFSLNNKYKFLHYIKYLVNGKLVRKKASNTLMYYKVRYNIKRVS